MAQTVKLLYLIRKDDFLSNTKYVATITTEVEKISAGNGSSWKPKNGHLPLVRKPPSGGGSPPPSGGGSPPPASVEKTPPAERRENTAG